VTRLCQLYGVTRAGFYAWRRRPVSAHAKQDRALLVRIRAHFAAHDGRYGSPRIHHRLVQEGWAVSRRRVARLMRAARLCAKAVRGYRAKVGVHRFYGRHPNLLRTARAMAPDQIWVGDITYLAVGGQWRYLAVVMDHFSRRVLAWSLGRRRDASVTRAVLGTAVHRRHPAPGLIFHRDRGSEYLAAPFREPLLAFGIRQSANVTGPGDNAQMESFFHSMKAELTRGVTFTDERTLRQDLETYLRYYNRTRLHSALGYRSPVDFEYLKS
jgi:transposase InsO family protein